MFWLGIDARAATITWDGNNNNSNSAWISATNWNPDSALRTGGAPTSADIAEFAGTGLASGIGINLNSASTNNGSNAQIVGQILQSGGVDRTIGNSSTATGGDGTLTIAGVSGVLIANTSSNNLTLAASASNGTKTMTLQFGSVGNIQVSGSGLITISTSISGTNGFIKTGNGQLDLTSSSSHTGTTTLRAGTLRITTPGAFGAAPASPTTVVFLEAGTLIADTNTGSVSNRGFALGPSSGSGSATVEVTPTKSFAINGVITNNSVGSGALIKTGTGTLVLGGNNSYSGGNTISAGTLRITNASGLGDIPAAATPGHLTINAGATFSIGTSSSFTLGTNRGIAIGPSTGSGSATMDVDTGITISYGGIMANNGTGTGSLIKTGGGGLTLTGSNTYTGTTSILGGTLTVDSGNAMGPAPGSATPGHITLNDGTLATSATFTLASARGIAIGTNGGTISPQGSTTLTYGGIIADSSSNGALTIGGTGTLVLTGSNSYTGGTTINGGGALQVGNGGSGTTGVGTLQLASNSTLYGTGTIRGNASITHSFAGIVRPGDRPTGVAPLGTLSVQGNLTLQSTASIFFELGSPSSAYDRIVGTTSGTTLTFDGTMKVDFASYTPHAGDFWDLLDWSNFVSTSFDPGTSLRTGADGASEGDLDLPNVSGFGLAWDVSSFTTNGILSLQVIPEPHRALLILLGSTAMLAKRRRA